MNLKWEIFVYILAGLLIIGLIVATFFPGTIRAWIDSGKSGNSKCDVPAGYTQEEWVEHMGHHPNIYAECLK